MAEQPDTEAITVDAFQRGAFRLVQPAGRGHRAGMDALILAACVPSAFAGHAVDLGAGAGAAGFSIAARCGQARVTLVERSPDMIACARRSLALDANRHLAARIVCLEADVMLTGMARRTAGLADHAFDFAVMNPPFNARADRATPDPLRQLAHVMPEGLFESWLRTAAAVLRPRGGLALIARPASLGAILAGMEGRFGGCEIVPVHPRADKAAIRIVLRAWKGARGGPAIRPPLVMHERDTALCARAEAIADGTATLFSD